MKSQFVAGAALAFAIVPSAFAAPEVVVETRILAQSITGSGAARQIANEGSVFQIGSRIRLTVQYRLLDQTAGVLGTLYGQPTHVFSIQSTGAVGNGTLSRSALTTTGTTASNGESGASNNSVGWANGAVYPQSGTFAGRSGLHAPFRDSLPSDNNQANGVISGGSIGPIVGFSNAANAQAFNQLGGQWWGLYSFEFQANPSFAGGVQFNTHSDTTVASVFRGTSLATATRVTLDSAKVSYQWGGISLLFANIDAPPAVAVSNRVIAADPFTSGDANNLTLASFSIANPSGFVDVTILNDGGIGVLGGVVTILDDNTASPSIVLNWDAPNVAIGQVYTVTFGYTDGIVPLQTGSVTVQVIPAPAGAAVLALGGVWAGRRRRSAVLL